MVGMYGLKERYLRITRWWYDLTNYLIAHWIDKSPSVGFPEQIYNSTGNGSAKGYLKITDEGLDLGLKNVNG